jgi:uncharacterized protein YecT (DUF1311 family)
MKINNAGITFILVAILVPISVMGASFDCKKSRTFIEKAICSNKQLSKLDDKLTEVYLKTLDIAFAPDDLKEEQREWLTNERNSCQDVTCLKRIYELRIQHLADYDVSQRTTSVKEPCEFPNLRLPGEYKVFAAGGYTGKTVDYQIDQSGHQATQMDVVVNHPSTPVVLVLGAYEPTIWNISWSPSTRIVAVLVSGYHRQAVAGLDPAVPVLNTSYDNSGPCGYFYVEQNELGSLNPLSRRFFRRPVDMVYLAKSGNILIGEAVPQNVNIITSEATPPESFYDKSAPLAGLAGLEDAVNKGLLRRATEADADKWVSATSANTSTKRDVPSIAGQEDYKPVRPNIYVIQCEFATDGLENCKRRHNAYVVLKKFIYPSGLYGEASSTFFIPKGIPQPTGNPGHSNIYDFNNLKIEGPISGVAQAPVKRQK